jgi:hypothetical protein
MLSAYARDLVTQHALIFHIISALAGVGATYDATLQSFVRR